MMSAALRDRARELTGEGSAYVIATVVRVERPASVEPGDVALVHRDGTIEGFVGGVCAQHSVRLYSLQALETGQPLLLRILPDAQGSDSENGARAEDPELTEVLANEDGTVTVQNPCLSGGAIEAFLEPVLPAPRVLVAGDSPIVGAMARIAPVLGLDFVAVGKGDDGVPMRGDLALVVAAHGRDELPILRAGLEAGVPYVGLVASRKRGGAVLDELRAEGVAQELVSTVETPAGIDIGARSAAEIAVSIFARIVEVRHRIPVPTPGAEAERPLTAVDPICGMTVVVDDDTPSLARPGGTVYFCCTGCKLRFEERQGDVAVS